MVGPHDLEDAVPERADGSGRWLGLDNTNLACHLLVHNSENAATRCARFIHLVDLFLLCRNGLDWTEVDRRVRTYSLGWRTYPAMALLERYFPGTVPAALVQVARRDASLAARRVMRSGIARVSFCDLADLDPIASLAGTAGLAAGALHALHAMLFKRLEDPTPTAGWSEHEVFENHRNRAKRLLAWLVGRAGYRRNVVRIFMRVHETSASKNRHGPP